MSNGDDVLDNWEEIDEAGLDSKLDKLKREREEPSTNQLEQYQEHNFTDTAMSFQNSIPMMMVMQQTENEYNSSNYTTQAMPTVKILRRPAQHHSGSNRDNGMRPKQPIKTLQQREQEYAEARLRILGSAKNPEDDLETSAAATASIVPKASQKPPADMPSGVSSQPIPQSPASTFIQLNSRTSLPGARVPQTMVNNSVSPTGMVLGLSGAVGGGVANFFSPTSSMMVGGVNTRYTENVLRMPRGPDGTSGFQMRR